MRPTRSGDLFLFLVFFASSFLLFGFDKVGALKPVKSGLSYLSDPIQVSLLSLEKGVIGQIEFLTKLDAIEEENRKLSQSKAWLEGEVEKLKEKERENKALTAQLGATEPGTYKLLPAKTVGLNRYLVIDKGERDGVKVGQTVIYGNNLIGKIVGATATLSKVKLLTDPDSKIQAVLYSGTKIIGVAVGNFGANIILDKISQDEVVQAGQAVLTEGEEGNYPKGLVIGKVESIKKEDVKLFQHIEVSSPLPYRDLDLVFIIQD
jgi:rod shape-determining protein MreC